MNSNRSNELAEKSILILGAYGLLGSGIAEYLSRRGATVKGFGRSKKTAIKVLPNYDWIIDDLRQYTEVEKWDGALQDVDTVINCSGALQDSPDDDLEVIHQDMVAALAEACSKHKIHLIQISAVGASENAATKFLSSKAKGDQAIRDNNGRYTIFRPGLVLASSAYGGTTLLRMLASVPYIHAISHPKTHIQTVSLLDIKRAIAASINGFIPNQFECDLVEENTFTLDELVVKMRRWLGFKPAMIHFSVPNGIATAVSKIADGLAFLGWKSPLRSTSLNVLKNGIEGDPSKWQSLGLFEISSLDKSLEEMPASAGDRLSARIALLSPLLICALSFFWCFSGLVGFLSLGSAAAVLEGAGWSHDIANASVVFWSLVDLLLGFGILIRNTARLACTAMIATSIFYLIASSIFVPELWLDPLGPLIKILPVIMLATVTSISLEKR